jgi:putative selenate reductase
VDELLHARLGWDDVVLERDAFAKDLQWADALPMLERLAATAARVGRRLGVKFTNTLVVRNTRGRLAGEQVYLSGAPLHVIATTLASRFAEATDGRFSLSFSAGLDAGNFADAVACGFAPATTCTDLLRPTGYRRLPRYLKALEADMERVGARDIPGYVRARAGAVPGVPAADAARTNLRAYAARVAGDPRYGAAAWMIVPAHRPALAALDCESCNNCALVCPNMAFFSVDTPPALLAGGAATREKQWVVYADAFNACGNCDTHCPQDGGPWRVKPRYDSGSGKLVAAGADAATLEALLVAAHGAPGWLAGGQHSPDG